MKYYAQHKITGHVIHLCDRKWCVVVENNVPIGLVSVKSTRQFMLANWSYYEFEPASGDFWVNTRIKKKVSDANTGFFYGRYNERLILVPVCSGELVDTAHGDVILMLEK